jgi:pyruvate dehydrogenase E1 component alpha subunit
MSDPGKYRTKEEVEEMMQYDPIYQFGQRLIEQERFTQADLDAVDQEILAQVEEAVKFSEESPFPPAESLHEDVYVRSPYIHLKAAERDPAWRASVRDDRVPEPFPAPAPAPAKVGS